MRVAHIHIPLIQDIYPGPTRCFRLDPPWPDPESGESVEYVSACVIGGVAGSQLPDVMVVAAEPLHGAPKGRSMRKLPGSATLYFKPEDPEHAWAYGLMALGVGRIDDDSNQ